MKKYFSSVLKNVILLNRFEFILLMNKVVKVNFMLKTNFYIKNILKNICIDSGNKRSVNMFFFLSRMSIKKNNSIGLINGLKKISW